MNGFIPIELMGYKVEFNSKELCLKIYDEHKVLNPESIQIRNIVNYLGKEGFIETMDRTRIRVEILRPV